MGLSVNGNEAYRQGEACDTDFSRTGEFSTFDGCKQPVRRVSWLRLSIRRTVCAPLSRLDPCLP